MAEKRTSPRTAGAVAAVNLPCLLTTFPNPTPSFLVVPSSSCPSHHVPAQKLICTTEEGEILLADWRARVGAGSGKAGAGGGGGGDDEAAGGNDAGDGGDVAPEFVKWVSSDHTRPCVALDKSPFFPGVLLSVGDWSFQIWKVKTATNETCWDG